MADVALQPVAAGGKIERFPAQTPVVMEAKDVTLGYQRDDGGFNTVLQNFSLQLHRQEVIALLGPSGVGKSSLLRVLAGLQEANRGQVTVAGQPISGPHPRTSFMFQSACLLPWLTTEQNVGFGLDFKHQPHISKAEKRQRVADAIAEVGLSDAAKAYPSELSGGMAQRVSLARSLARQPEILLLDEPFSALDEITRGEMQQLTQEVAARHNTAVVLVTHDIDEALLLADRVLLIGGQPGQLLKDWHIDLPHPRDEAEEQLTQMRVDIIRLMREARQAA